MKASNPTQSAAEALVSKQSDDSPAPGAPAQTGKSPFGPWVKAAPKR